MNKYFKIKMTETRRLLGPWPTKQWTFFKGRVYTASYATNQPSWEADGKVFAQKVDGGCMLLNKTEYVKIE